MPGVATKRWVTDGDLDNVLARLRELKRLRALKAYVESGRLLLEGCYGGSVEAWRSKSPNKRDSLRRMAARKDCEFSHEQLHRFVAVYVACKEMPFVFKRKHITASHVVAVLGLEHDERVAFLERAHAEKWSVRTLKQAVIDYRRDQGERRGAPVATPYRLAGTRIARCRRPLEESVELLSSPGSEPPPDVGEQLLGDLDRLGSLIDHARRQLKQQREPGCARHAFRAGDAERKLDDTGT